VSSMLCIATDVELNSYELYGQNDAYATTPMATVTRMPQAIDEEVLYTSFEEAISDRVVALHGRLSRLSNPQLQVECSSQTSGLIENMSTSILSEQKGYDTQRSLFGRGWQLGLMWCCLALMFTLLGFDLMGLLVLHAH